MLRLTACAAALLTLCTAARASEPVHAAELDAMIARQAKRHGVPEKLVRRIVMRESRYNPRARNHSFWGLMQISYPTARSMGLKGSPSDLLDPVVNLTYAVPYLANAFIIAGKQEDAAVRLYAHGYYAAAKNQNLLRQLRTAESEPLVPDDNFLAATARPVSNLITAVINGPQASQQVAEVSPTPSAAQVDTDGSKVNEPQIAMVSGKSGYAPPPKWVKDGGVSLVARGEQRIELVAAYSLPSEAADPRKGHRTSAAHGRGKKNADFASLDAPPASVQAYATPVSALDSGPQAAIALATSNATAPENAPEAADPAIDGRGHKATRAKGGHARKAVANAREIAEPAPTAAADPTISTAAMAEPATRKPATRMARVAAKKTSHAVSIAEKVDETSPQAASH